MGSGGECGRGEVREVGAELGEGRENSSKRGLEQPCQACLSAEVKSGERKLLSPSGGSSPPRVRTPAGDSSSICSAPSTALALLWITAMSRSRGARTCAEEEAEKSSQAVSSRRNKRCRRRHRRCTPAGFSSSTNRIPASFRGAAEARAAPSPYEPARLGVGDIHHAEVEEEEAAHDAQDQVHVLQRDQAVVVVDVERSSDGAHCSRAGRVVGRGNREMGGFSASD